MNSREALAAVGRRWYVIVVGVVVAAGATNMAINWVPPIYSASGTVLLLPSRLDPAQGQNPLLNLDSLEVPASIITGYADSDAAHQRISESAPSAKYTIGIDASLRGPVILATVEDTDPASVLPTLDLVLEYVPEALKTLQSELRVPDGAAITSMRLAVDNKTTVNYSKTVRAAGGVVLAVLGLSALLALGIDARAARRRNRPRDSLTTTEDTTDGDPLETGDVDGGEDDRLFVDVLESEDGPLGIYRTGHRSRPD